MTSTTRFRRAGLIGATIFGAIALSASNTAVAAVVLAAGNFGGTGVHSDKDLNASTVTGHAGSQVTDPLVTFTTTGDTLKTSGNGESTYAAGDGSINDLVIEFTEDYTAVTFNLTTVHNVTSTMHLSVNDGAFVFDVPFVPEFPDPLGNGQNKFTLTADGTDSISKLSFTFNPGVANIKQVRVGGVYGVPVDPQGGVPEPATWAMMLVGFFGLGSMVRTLRSRRAIAAL